MPPRRRRGRDQGQQQASASNDFRFQVIDLLGGALPTDDRQEVDAQEALDLVAPARGRGSAGLSVERAGRRRGSRAPRRQPSAVRSQTRPPPTPACCAARWRVATRHPTIWSGRRRASTRSSAARRCSGFCKCAWAAISCRCERWSRPCVRCCPRTRWCPACSFTSAWCRRWRAPRPRSRPASACSPRPASTRSRSCATPPASSSPARRRSRPRSPAPLSSTATPPARAASTHRSTTLP